MKLFNKINFKALAIAAVITGACSYDKSERYPIADALGNGIGAGIVYIIPALVIAKGEKDYAKKV